MINIYGIMVGMILAIFVYLLVFRRISLLKCSLISFGITLLLAIIIWQIRSDTIFLASEKAIKVAIDILLIIVGAILFLEILNKKNIILRLIIFLESISADYRIQIIFLAWFLENFLEGVAGFGTPSTIVAPILVGMGISPITAVILALLGNSTSVVFGAVGTPIRVGFAGLEIVGVEWYAAAINLVGMVVPAMMMWVIVKTQKRNIKEFFEILPLALWSGFVFSISSYLVALFSQELASIVGAILGLGLVLMTIKLKIFLPREEIPFQRKTESFEKGKLLEVIAPYLLLIGGLIIGKKMNSGINPGWIFLIVAIILTVCWREKNIFPIIKSSIKKSIEPFLVILLMSGMVQLMTLTANNYSGLLSMLDYLVVYIKLIGAEIMAPILGAFGSFITGSATISNIMFGSLLFKISQETGENTAFILGLQLVGGAAGNMIALADVLVAETVVGIKNQENILIKKLLPYCLVIVGLTIMVGVIFS